MMNDKSNSVDPVITIFISFFDTKLLFRNSTLENCTILSQSDLKKHFMYIVDCIIVLK